MPHARFSPTNWRCHNFQFGSNKGLRKDQCESTVIMTMISRALLTNVYCDWACSPCLYFCNCIHTHPHTHTHIHRYVEIYIKYMCTDIYLYIYFLYTHSLTHSRVTMLSQSSRQWGG